MMNDLMDAIGQGKARIREAAKSLNSSTGPEDTSGETESQRAGAPAEVEADEATGRQSPPAAPPAYTDTKIGRWLQDAVGVANIAKSLAKTEMTPSSLRNKPAEVTAVILAGDEVGMSPIQALQNINYISGRPSLSTLAIRALVVSGGHYVWVENVDDDQAVVLGQRKGSRHEQKSVWTIERAEKLGLLAKDNWRKQPQNMLVARATAEVCRLIAPDMLLGIGYTSEELLDGIEKV